MARKKLKQAQPTPEAAVEEVKEVEAVIEEIPKPKKKGKSNSEKLKDTPFLRQMLENEKKAEDGKSDFYETLDEVRKRNGMK